MKGTFFGIGVGPGDPELLTVKAIRAMEKADVLIAPKTEKKDGSVALSIARPYLKKDIEIVYQVFPMVANFAESTKAWEENKAEILALLEAGKNVAFLTLGDPMFYSTYIYVYRLLEHEAVTIETIPGIPAFCAIGSKLGYPIVEGNDILSIIPATASPEKIAKILPVTEEEGMAGNAVMVSRCGLPDEERIDDIEAQKDKKVNYLSTILTRRNA